MRKFADIISVVVVTASFFFTAISYADILYLKNGRRIEGEIFKVKDGKIWLKAFGGEVGIEKAQIESIERKAYVEKERKKREVYDEPQPDLEKEGKTAGNNYYKWSERIYINKNFEPIRGKTKKEVLDLRKSKIKEYKKLSIFPADYQPKESIYGQVEDGRDWERFNQFYIVNPYLLISTSPATYITPFLESCSVDFTVYSHRKIEIKYRGQSAKCWFESAYKNYFPDRETKQIVRLCFVNASDAEFSYAHVDMSQSVNINLEWYAGGGESMLRGLYSGHDLFHAGPNHGNNLSPDDDRAKLKLAEKNKKTIIYIKLWRERPETKEAKEDFAYVIRVEP